MSVEATPPAFYIISKVSEFSNILQYCHFSFPPSFLIFLSTLVHISVSFFLFLSVFLPLSLSVISLCFPMSRCYFIILFFRSSRNFLAHWISSFTTLVSSKEEVWVPWAPYSQCHKASAAAGVCCLGGSCWGQKVELLWGAGCKD